MHAFSVYKFAVCKVYLCLFIIKPTAEFIWESSAKPLFYGILFCYTTKAMWSALTFQRDIYVSQLKYQHQASCHIDISTARHTYKYAHVTHF